MKIGGGEKGKEQGAWSKEAVLSPQLAGGRDSILRSHSLTLLQPQTYPMQPGPVFLEYYHFNLFQV